VANASDQGGGDYHRDRMFVYQLIAGSEKADKSN